MAAIDGSDRPSEENLDTFLLDQPFVVAQVYPLDQDSRDGATLSALRLLALADRRDPAAGDDPRIRLRFHDNVVDDQGFEGHHIRFEVDLDKGTAIEEQFAVFDPERTRIHQVRVACSLACFEANADYIDELFESLTLVQTRKVPPIPVILAGDDEYWKGLLGWIESTLLREGKIGPEDLALVKRARSAEEVLAFIAAGPVR